GKWARRHPGLAAGLACALLAGGVAAFFAYHAHHLDQQRLIETARLREEQERARLQLLDEKIRTAYIVATSGDLKKTDEAIKAIEDLGASTGQVRLLRGMVYHFRGDNEHALSELEQAVKLLPESVAARALLAAACFMDAQWLRRDQIMREMEDLSPATPEDFLLKGYVLSAQRP